VPSNPGALRVVLTRASRKALERDAARVVEAAKGFAPKESGALAADIHYTIEGGSPETLRALIGSNKHYTEAVEKGSGIYGPTGRPIRPRRAKVMVFNGRKGVVFAKSVKGQPGQHFLKRALQSLRSR
jgi:hypothetical protein